MMTRFPLKTDAHGRALLNLACGTRTDTSWNNVDFSSYALLRHYNFMVKVLRKLRFISDQRYERLQAIDSDIIRWNLVRGIPFDDNTFDVVYHSHFLEHLDRDAAAACLLECHRVLKPGGILRVVVPDLELLVKWYRESLDELDRGNLDAESRHERAICDLFDQMVRTGSSGTAEQKPWVRRIEGLIRGSAAATGENHRWMYDRHSLGRTLTRVGFTEVCGHSATTSSIARWERCFSTTILTVRSINRSRCTLRQRRCVLGSPNQKQRIPTGVVLVKKC